MTTGTPNRLNHTLAKVCEKCPVCRTARRKQKGAAYRLVKNLEDRICPFCQAYERVHGRKAHEPAAASPRALDQ